MRAAAKGDIRSANKLQLRWKVATGRFYIQTLVSYRSALRRFYSADVIQPASKDFQILDAIGGTEWPVWLRHLEERPLRLR
jgi:hypothetical protein